MFQIKKEQMKHLETLFSPKEMYLMTFDKNGHRNIPSMGSEHYQRIRRQENLHLINGIEFTEKNSFAILQPYNGSCNWNIHPYSERNKLDGKGQAIHFFQHDYIFNSIWTRTETEVYKLAKFDAVFTPDFSLWVDAPEQVNKQAVYKSRLIGAYMQNCGFNVIPTFSWGNASTLDWSLEGLPEGGAMGTCGIGIRQHKAAFSLWCYGMRRVEEEKHPDIVFVYGEPVDIPGFTTEIHFISPNISKFRKNEEG